VGDGFSAKSPRETGLDTSLVELKTLSMGDEMHAVDAIDIVLEETAGVPLEGGIRVFGNSLLQDGEKVVGEGASSHGGGCNVCGVDAIVAPAVTGKSPF
jgi:hypothetical protein